MKNKLVSVSVIAHPEQDSAEIVAIDNVGSKYLMEKFGSQAIQTIFGSMVNSVLDGLRESKIAYSFKKSVAN